MLKVRKKDSQGSDQAQDLCEPPGPRDSSTPYLGSWKPLPVFQDFCRKGVSRPVRNPNPGCPVSVLYGQILFVQTSGPCNRVRTLGS